MRRGAATFALLCAPLVAPAQSRPDTVPVEPRSAPVDSSGIDPSIVAPSVAREFRGVWVTSVSNMDWPSRPGLPVEEQKAELITILDRAASLNLNAVVLQVRPQGDALYA